MPATRCPVVVGRRAELAALQSALAAARLGRGGATALTGPAGIGKSRVARETGVTADGWDMRRVAGRAVPGCGPFRPLTEALLAGLRLVPDLAEGTGYGPLVEYRPLLGRVLPHWRTADVVTDEPLVVAEAVLQMLAALAGAHGLLVVLEDLHWADPDTLTVLEYLVDNASGTRVTLVLTARDEPGPVSRMLRALVQRGTCDRLRLGPLAAPEIEEIAAACLGGAPAAAVRDAVVRRAGGVPLLAEELVAGPDPDADVPASLAESVAERLDALPGPARRCAEVAAVVGESADWRLVGAVLGADESGVLDAVRAATRVGLLDVVDDDPDVVRFRHALARDAVLASMLPPERVGWARRALEEVRRTHPDLDGSWCETACDLAVRGGDDAAAAAVLHEAGRRYLRRGALASAEEALRRARTLAGAPDPAIEADLAETLVGAGRAVEAVEVGGALLRLVEEDPAALGEARIGMARAYAAAGDRTAAAAELDRARGCGADAVRVAAVAARVAIADGRLDDARTLATEALRDAEPAGRVDVVVDSLLVLGRLARREDLGEAERLFVRARDVADGAGAAVAAARAQYEIAITDTQHGFRVDRLDRARSRLRTAGDLAGVAVLDLQEAATRVVRWEPEQALEAAERCVAASRRLGLETLPKALVLVAAALTHLDRHDAAAAAAGEAAALAPDDTHLEGERRHIRAVRALDRADDGAALRHLDRAVAAFRSRPDAVTGSPAVGLWVLVSTVADSDTATVPKPPAPVADRCNLGLVRFAEAVVAARAGVPDAAAFEAADRLLREPVDLEWHRRQAHRLVAAAALAGGWGEPGRWSAEDLAAVEGRGRRAWAGALRGQLRRSGAVVPRRGRGTTAVPARLRALHVTSREADVLALVAEGCGNREIAERLVLSPRTVEKHVEHLLAKTGRTRRTELVADAAALLDGRAPDVSWGSARR